MLKEFNCIICPNGCDITAKIEDKKIISVEGATCERGYEYAEQELTDPHRSIASSVLLEGGSLPLVSVRLTSTIPKGKIFDVIAVIKKVHLKAPVFIGQVAIENVLGLGSDVIVTKNVMEK
jgi:CxxC motif-containing protein